MKEWQRKETLHKAIFWISLVLILTGIIGCSVKWYHLYRDLDAVIDRAQVGANAHDMLEYMNKLKVNLEKYNATSGHMALIFKTPMTNLALHYRAVNKVIDRLEDVSKMPKTSVAYQTALDDLRGIIRELPNPAKKIMWVRCGWWILLLSLLLSIPGGYSFTKAYFD